MKTLQLIFLLGMIVFITPIVYGQEDTEQLKKEEIQKKGDIQNQKDNVNNKQNSQQKQPKAAICLDCDDGDVLIYDFQCKHFYFYEKQMDGGLKLGVSQIRLYIRFGGGE